MELWVTEYQTKNVAFGCRVKETLFNGKSDFQDIALVDTEEFGKMLILDGVIQTTVFDEFAYHEMIVHVPLFTHPNPKRVLVVGGGDGGSIREVVKHKEVEIAEMVEIDGTVVELCKKYLPENSCALSNNERVRLTIGDGIKHMKKSKGVYDVIIVDCSDPIGPGEGLFTRAFYQDVYNALKDDGLFVQQTESPFYHRELIKRISKDVGSIFPIKRLYTTNVPTYPGSLHCFTLGSKKYDPLAVEQVRDFDFPTRYYTKELQKSCFVLPEFVAELTR